MSSARAVAIAAMAAVVQGSVYDVVMPSYIANNETCPQGCAQWNALPDTKTQAYVDAMWLNGKPPSDAGNSCAMPAVTAGDKECDGCKVDEVWNSFAGPWCYCSGANATYQYCKPGAGSIPEQINLQVAHQNVVVASFVTHDDGKPTADSHPVASFRVTGSTQETEVKGISHFYEKLTEAEGRNYILHFVKLVVVPGQTYQYKVRSGTSGAAWSDYFTFRAPADKTVPTRIGIYGDMGHSRYNNMGNLKDDCAAGTIDTIVHMGDHAYDMGNARDERGDAYMNAYQPALSTCPWIPIIGNHEGNDGDHFKRYLNMTWGETLGGSDGLHPASASIHSTADTALGELLTKATMFGAGFHGNVPSNTSRFFSVSVGMIHLIGLDLNKLDPAQLAWLDADLSAVDRAATPWVVASSHFPLYHATVAAHLNYSAASYIGEAAEHYASSGHEFVEASCSADACEQTVGELLGKLQAALDPVFYKHKVDLYIAGHVHDYNSNFPLCFDPASNKTAQCQKGGKPQTDFDHPLGVVHITEGNGGVPGVVGKSNLNQACNSTNAPWCNTHGDGGAYGRLVAESAHVMTYAHVQNNGGNVTDSITITK